MNLKTENETSAKLFKSYKVLKRFLIPGIRVGSASSFCPGDYLIQDLRDNVNIVGLDWISTRLVGINRGNEMFQGKYIQELLDNKDIEEVNFMGKVTL